jgi:hypothetical protein
MQILSLRAADRTQARRRHTLGPRPRRAYQIATIVTTERASSNV